MKYICPDCDGEMNLLHNGTSFKIHCPYCDLDIEGASIDEVNTLYTDRMSDCSEEESSITGKIIREFIVNIH